MAVSIVQSKNMQGGYNASHTISALDVSGTDTYALQASFNRNPASDVSSYTIGGSAPTAVVSSINVNVSSVAVKGRLLNSASVDMVTNTPSYKLEAMIGVGLAGVDQTTPVETTYTPGNQYGNTPNVSRTGTSGNTFLVFIAYKSDVTLTASAGMTVLQNIAHTDANLGQCWAGYVACTGSAQTIGATSGTTDNYEIVVVEVKGAGAAAARRRIIIS